MPRPRFDKLDPSLKAKIIAVATNEFAEHGFERASYNRIIEHCGLSKGAMYYYFDDKEDLFVTTLRDTLQRLILDAGSVATATSAEAFWQAVEDWYRRSLQLFQEDPAAIGLARSLIKSMERGSGSGALTQLRRFGREHIAQFIAYGQHLGAVRSDLPAGLLQSAILALEEGIDLWLLDQIPELEPRQLDEMAQTLTALYARVAAPGGLLPTRTKRARKRKEGK